MYVCVCLCVCVCVCVYRFLQLLVDHRYFSESHIVSTYLVTSRVRDSPLYFFLTLSLALAHSHFLRQFNPQESVRVGMMLSQFTKLYSDYQLASLQVSQSVCLSVCLCVCLSVCPLSIKNVYHHPNYKKHSAHQIR